MNGIATERACGASGVAVPHPPSFTKCGFGLGIFHDDGFLGGVVFPLRIFPLRIHGWRTSRRGPDCQLTKRAAPFGDSDAPFGALRSHCAVNLKLPVLTQISYSRS